MSLVPSVKELRDDYFDGAVFAAMTEIKYQLEETAKADRPDMVELNGAGYLLAMEENMRRARETWYVDAAPHPNAAEYVRKVVALGLRMLEDAGAPYRK